VPVADGFLARRFFVDGFEGQGDFDEFFTVGRHAITRLTVYGIYHGYHGRVEKLAGCTKN
jgi:hypothetical protein